MRRSRFSEAQIMFILRQAEEGIAISDVCHSAGISKATFYAWRKKLLKSLPAGTKRLERLEKENQTLRKIISQLSPEDEILPRILVRKP